MKNKIPLIGVLLIGTSVSMASPLANFVNWLLPKPASFASHSIPYGKGHGNVWNKTLEGFRDIYNTYDNFTCSLAHAVTSEDNKKVGIHISGSGWNDSMRQSTGCFIEGTVLLACGLSAMYKVYTSAALAKSTLVIGGWSAISLGLMCWGALRVRRAIKESKIEDPTLHYRPFYEMFEQRVEEARHQMIIVDTTIKSAEIRRTRSWLQNEGAHTTYN